MKLKLLSGLLILFLIVSTESLAQFSGCYAGSNWTSNTSNTNGTVFIQTGGLSLLADTDGNGNGGGTTLDCGSGGMGNVSACIIIPFSGQLIFDWSWSGGNLSNFLTEPFGYCLNGVPTTLTSVNPPPFGTGAGTDTVIVMAGDTFCFVVSSLFADSHPTLPTSIGVTNFSGPCSAPPVTCTAGFSYVSSTAWDSIIFTDSSSNNITQWLWTFGDGNSSTLANPTHTFSAPGTYNVCLIVSDSTGCSDTICESVAVFFTGINDGEELSKISCTVSPNPSNGQFEIFLENVKEGQVIQIHIFDMYGKKMLSQSLTYSNKVLNLDLKFLDTGNYLMQIEFQNEMITKKILIL